MLSWVTQYGYASFPVDQLPDVVLTKIVDYLDIEDTGSLRRVTPWLAQRILLLDQKMQKWTVKVCKNEMLEAAAQALTRAEKKQVKMIKNFQLKFKVQSVYQKDFDVPSLVNLIESWQDYTLELDIEVNENMINCFTGFHLAKLSNLSIGVRGISNEGIVNTEAQIIQNHAHQLKSLTIHGNQDFPQLQFDTAPRQLQIFKLKWDLDVYRPIGLEILPLLDFSRNVTKLALRNVFLPSLESKSLVFPNLKHLEIDCSKGSRLARCNASHLETLVVYKASHNLEFSVLDAIDFRVIFPTCFPRLKTFMCWDIRHMIQLKLLRRMLAPGATPVLKNLLVYHQEYLLEHHPVISLPTLTHFVFIGFDPWCQQMVAANVNTLEALVFYLDTFEESDVKLVDLLATMPNLKHLVILWNGSDSILEVMARPCMEELRARCPNVKITWELDLMTNRWLHEWYLQSEIDESFKDASVMDAC